MSRSGGVIWLPVVALAALAALVFVKPWHHLTGPSLPAVFPVTIPRPQTTPSKGPKMSAAQLAATLDASSSTAIVATPLRWHCTTDPHHVWDYTCSQAQLREVRGYDVNASQITQSTTLVYAGHKLGP
jgi:hypothetical protein